MSKKVCKLSTRLSGSLTTRTVTQRLLQIRLKTPLFSDCRIESILTEFWDLEKAEMGDVFESKRVRDYVTRSDCLGYQKIVDFFLPKVLSPIPSPLTQSIRNFAKSIEAWVTKAVQWGIHQELVESKASSVDLGPVIVEVRTQLWGGPSIPLIGACVI